MSDMIDPTTIAPLICGFAVSGDKIEDLSWASVSKGSAARPGERRWLHLDRRSPAAKSWLLRERSVDAFAANALFQEDTRPRAHAHRNSLLVNLRGINLNPGAQPEDMVSLRIWVTEDLVITTQARHIRATEDLASLFRSGEPPASNGAVIAYFAATLARRMEPVIDKLDEHADALEERLLDSGESPPKIELSGFRRSVLQLRRYILPQREALSALIREQVHLLTEDDRLSLRETQDTVTRLGEDLDTIRERALVIQEQIVELRAEAMNQRLFVLAIISAIFLPLGFVTGLFGVNVGGMPGVGSAAAFTFLCASLVLLTLGLLSVFKRMDWL